MLGVDFIPVETSLLDTAESLEDHELISQRYGIWPFSRKLLPPVDSSSDEESSSSQCSALEDWMPTFSQDGDLRPWR